MNNLLLRPGTLFRTDNAHIIGIVIDSTSALTILEVSTMIDYAVSSKVRPLDELNCFPQSNTEIYRLNEPVKNIVLAVWHFLFVEDPSSRQPLPQTNESDSLEIKCVEVALREITNYLANLSK